MVETRKCYCGKVLLSKVPFDGNMVWIYLEGLMINDVYYCSSECVSLKFKHLEDANTELRDRLKQWENA